jgi:hypothetical protein
MIFQVAEGKAFPIFLIVAQWFTHFLPVGTSDALKRGTAPGAEISLECDQNLWRAG